MTSQEKRELLRSALRYAESTKELVSEPGAIGQLPRLIGRQFTKDNIFIPVADEHTWNAAGLRTVEILSNAGISMANPYIFPGSPMLEAEYGHAQQLSKRFAGIKDGIPIAIGSGTINDLVKMGAHLAHRPYICVATACSVDGYASNGAALLTDGAKMTHACPAPRIIVGDSEIMDKAPARMLASGYADLIAKMPAGADWIVADHLGLDPINPVSWSLVQEHLREWLADPKDSDAIFTGLNLCGIAMQYQKSSRPVSGAEHLLSHVWEMEHHTHEGEPLLHGIKVGIGVLVISSIYELLINEGISGGVSLLSSYETRQRKELLLETLFKEVGGIEKMKQILCEKYKEPDAQFKHRALLNDTWGDLAEKIKMQIYPYDTIVELLESAGAATKAAQIGMAKDKVFDTLVAAQLIRNRYTVLDVLDDLGLMETIIHKLNSRSDLL